MPGAFPPTLKRRRRKSEPLSVTPDAVLRLLDRQRFRCALTGRALTPDTASLDHIIPVSRGGEHRIDNTQILERSVNRAKGTLTNAEFIALCAEVARHVSIRRQPKSKPQEASNEN